MFAFCHLVKYFKDEGCELWEELNEESMRGQMIWFEDRDIVWSCDLPLSFWRWSLMDIRSVIVSIPSVREVLNASSIQIAALLYIFTRVLSGYDKEAWL